MPQPAALQGNRVRLRPTQLGDRKALVEIRSSPEVRARWRGQDLNAEFLEDLAGDGTQFTIEALTGEVIGLIQYYEEDDAEYRHASLDIYLDPATHRQGFGLDAIATLVRYLVDVVGHHRLTIDPATDNEAAIACYRKAGFRPVGVMREYERQADGTWADGFLMEYLASDHS